jgi:hypothetical protein
MLQIILTIALLAIVVYGSKFLRSVITSKRAQQAQQSGAPVANVAPPQSGPAPAQPSPAPKPASRGWIGKSIPYVIFLAILAIIGYATYLIIHGGGLNIDPLWQQFKNLFPTTEDGWAILIASFGLLTFFLFYKEKYKFGSILLLIFLFMWVGRNQWYDSKHPGPPQAVRGGITTGHSQGTNQGSITEPLEKGWVADADENCSPISARRPITVVTRHNRSGADIQYRVSSTNWRYEWNSQGSGTWQQVLSRNNFGNLSGFRKIGENNFYATYCGKSGYMPGGVQKWKNEILMIRKEVK